MNIVVVHHFYRNGAASGENAVVKDHIEALRNNGHRVTLISRESRNIVGNFFSLVKISITWALNLGANPIRIIRDLKPDIVIVHNLYPGFTSRWIQNANLPVIYWLHNFRFYCIASTFLHNNEECLICLHGISYKSLWRRCADKSFFKTIFAFLRLKINRNLPERTYPERWVALSPKARDIFLQTSLDDSKIEVIPNFARSKRNNGSSKDPDKWIFVGRLTRDKGVFELAKSVPDSIQLDIYGNGPLKKELESLASKRNNLFIQGEIDRESLLRVLPNYIGGFIPSLWVEGIPTTFLEYAAAKLPVIGWKSNATSDFIEQYQCGIVLLDFNENLIEKAIFAIEANRTFFSKNSFRMWSLEFSEEVWLLKVNRLIENLLSSKR